MTTIEEAKVVAKRHYEAGDCTQAAVVCREILKARPSDADTIHFLGLIAVRQGRPDLALEFLQQSIALQPSRSLFHSNLGAAWNALGKSGEAIASYARATQLDANSHEAHSGLAFSLSCSGDFDRAEFHCQAALRLRPDCADAWNVRGNIARLQGRWEQAVEHFSKALAIDPSHSTAQNNLAASLHVLGRKQEAMAGYKKTLAASPHYAGAHNNLAALLQEFGNLDDAETHLREAVRLQPGMSDPHNNLGGVLQLQARLDEAIACFRTAEALAPADAASHSNLLLCLNYHPKVDAATLLAEHRRWGERVERAAGAGPGRRTKLASPSESSARGGMNATRPLRVGYVSPDFCVHATAGFVEPILAHHDPEQVESFCYAEVAAPDETTARMKKAVRAWRSTVGMSDSAVADLIRRDQIDILVDLAGHTAKSRLAMFAHKPAPVQVTYLGYPNTTGLATIDYRLTDAITDPPGEPRVHTEELFRLPRAFCCYGPRDSDPPVNPLPAERAGYVTFGSLHTLPRLNRGVLDTWCAILRAAPTTRLLVFRHTLRGKVRDELLRYITSQGVASERISLENTVQGPGGYPSVYHQVDISLDTFPWSGHTTACQSLWMGVPVITLRGTRFAGRMVASVLQHGGLPELIAETREQYIEKAVNLAADKDSLARLRANLRQQLAASTLCDAAGFTRDLEMSYRQMWTK